MSNRLLAFGSLLILLVAWPLLLAWFLLRPYGLHNWDRLVEAFDRAFLEVRHG